MDRLSEDGLFFLDDLPGENRSRVRVTGLENLHARLVVNSLL